MNKIVFLCWRRNAHGECWSALTTPPSPVEAGVVTATLSCILFSFPGMHIHAWLYRLIYFLFVFTADMPNYSFLPNWMTHICILQVYSGNTYNSSKALVLYSAAEAKKLQRHPPATYFIVWDFTEPGADTITVTTGTHLGYSLWPTYLLMATRITTPRGWWFVGIQGKGRFLRRILKE